MAVIHKALAVISKPGVARLFYAHPALQKTSLILNNTSVIKAEPRSIVKITIKMMPSGKRILLACDKIESAHIKSVQDFIMEVGEERMKLAAEREAPNGYSIIKNFDGKEDAKYYVGRFLPRFGDKESQEAAPEGEEEYAEDGYANFGELFIPKLVINALNAAREIATVNSASNILLVGSSGNGKTSLGKAFADTYGYSFTKVNCSVIRDPEEWFGYREAQDGTTVFVETEFTKRVKEGNAVILLDEINRLEPYLHNSLMPLLDESRKTTVHGNTIEVGPNVVFICTMNLGTSFVGTFILDGAIRNRMDITITMPKLTPEREAQLLVERVKLETEKAAKVVKLMERIRDAAAKHQIDIDVSHRSALKVARLLKTSLLDYREALTLVVFNNTESPEQAKLLMDTLVGA